MRGKVCNGDRAVQSDYHGLRKPDIALGSGRGDLCVPYAYLAGVKALAGRRGV